MVGAGGGKLMKATGNAGNICSRQEISHGSSGWGCCAVFELGL